MGVSWGVWLLLQIGRAGAFTGIWGHQVNAHGHAQVFGGVGLFVMGFGYQMFPALWQRRLAASRLCAPVFAARASGSAARTAALAWHQAPWALPVVIGGGLREIAAITAFVVQLLSARRGSPSHGTLRSRRCRSCSVTPRSEMTMRYAHLSPDTRRDAVALLDLGAQREAIGRQKSGSGS